jgi:2-haloacid dehalogenase
MSHAEGDRAPAGATPATPGLTASTVVFDLGGVLIEWDSRRLYRRLIADPDEVEAFLEEVGFLEWNARIDAGLPFAEAVAELAARHPARRDLIEAFHARWAESMGDEIAGTVAILRELRERGVRLLALSNWSAETYPIARERFAFLAWFEGIVLSGSEGVAKPDPRLFEILVARYRVDPREAVFIDDSAANAAVAGRLGFHAIRFSDPASLRARLVELGLLPVEAAGPGQPDRSASMGGNRDARRAG